MRRALRVLMIGVLIAIPIVALRNDTSRAWLAEGMLWLRAQGILGLPVFYGVQILSALLTSPIWLMSGIAGYVYGFPYGIAVALPGVALAASCTFLVGRILFRRGLRPRITTSGYFQIIETVARRSGFKAALLLRATPVMPQNLLSYLLAATPMKVHQFALGTLLGMIPMTCLHVYVGSIVGSAAELLSGESPVTGPLRWGSLLLVGALSVAAIVAVSRVAKRALDDALLEASASPKEGRSSGER